MKITLIGLTLEGMTEPRKRKVVISIDNDWNTKTLLFPNDKPWNKGQIQKFIGQQYGVPPGEIIWPPYIEVPKL